MLPTIHVVIEAGVHIDGKLNNNGELIAAIATVRHSGFSQESLNDLYLPNVFGPNADGINDYFEAFMQGECVVEQFKISIFDRWKNSVFGSKRFDFKWDGSSEMEPLNPSVFVWYVEYTVAGSSELVRLASDVTILK